MSALSKARIVSASTSLPCTLAAARLANWGATVIKLEPPSGDPLKAAAPVWYKELTQKQTILSLDLKSPRGQAQLEVLLKKTQLLLTAFRPEALRKNRLDAKSLKARFPRLSAVELHGFSGADRNRAGHDLNFQARAGLIAPDQMPQTLWADFLAAERITSLALISLLGKKTAKKSSACSIAIADIVQEAARPWTEGLTKKTGLLGGGSPRYALYRSKDGACLALAALEDSFWDRLRQSLNLPLEPSAISEQTLAHVFRQRTAQQWERWASLNDIPLTRVR